MSKLRIAVVGAGHLGKIHAKLAATQPDGQLVAIVDPSSDVRKSMEETHGCSTFNCAQDISTRIF